MKQRLSSRLKTTSLFLNFFIVVCWVSLAGLWAFPREKTLPDETMTENVRLPRWQWAQDAEEEYSPLLFLVYPKEHKWVENIAEQYRWWLMIPTFLIGLLVPSALFIMLLMVFDVDSIALLSLKVFVDATLFAYLSVGTFLLWWAWLF